MLKLPLVPDQIVWTPSDGLNDTTIFNPMATPTQTTTYQVSTVSGYCPAQSTVTVQVNPLLIQAVHYNIQNNICTANYQVDSISTNYNGASSLSYTWNHSSHLSNPDIENPSIVTDSSAWYVVTIQTPNGCIAKDSIHVYVSPLIIDAGNSHYLLCGESVQLDSVTSNYTGEIPLTYLWSPSNGLSDTTIPNPYAVPTNQVYTVTAYLDTICEASDMVGVYFLTMNPPSICIVTVDSNSKLQSI